MTPKPPEPDIDEVSTTSGVRGADSGGSQEDDGDVPDKQIQRWKDEGGSVLPLD